MGVLSIWGHFPLEEARPLVFKPGLEGGKSNWMLVGTSRILLSNEFVWKEHTSRNIFRKLVKFIGVNKSYITILGLSRTSQGECISLEVAIVLGMPPLHDEKFKVLLDMTL